MNGWNRDRSMPNAVRGCVAPSRMKKRYMLPYHSSWSTNAWQEGMDLSQKLCMALRGTPLQLLLRGHSPGASAGLRYFSWSVACPEHYAVRGGLALGVFDLRCSSKCWAPECPGRLNLPGLCRPRRNVGNVLAVLFNCLPDVYCDHGNEKRDRC